MYLIKAEIAVVAFLVFIAALALKVSYGWIVGVPFLLVFVFIVIIFRQPKRSVVSSPRAIVAPIDSVVETVFSAKEPFLKTPCLVVRLRRRHLGIMGLYSPAQGQVQQAWYGENYQRIADQEAKDKGHINTFWIRTDEGDNLMMSFFRAATVRYLNINHQPGERIGQGRLIGLSSIRFVDILLPVDVNLKVSAGDTLVAGESLIGQFVHRAKKKNAKHSIQTNGLT